MARLRELDALRGLAAVAVLLFHYTWWYQRAVGPHRPGLLFAFHAGALGVDLFFLISGFVILMTLERSRSLADFAVSRFARLYPAYAVCATIALAVIVLGRFNPNHVNLPGAAVSFTMLSGLTFWPPVDGSYWTLTYEVLFYVAAGVLYLGLGWRRIERPAIAWLAVAAAGRLAHLASRSHRVNALFDLSFANLFVAGMMLHRIAAGRASSLTYVTLALAFGVTLLPTEWAVINVPMPVYVALVTGFAGAVFAAARGWLTPLNWPPLLFLGDISYSLYLIHQLVGFWVIHRLEALGIGPNLAILAAIAVAIGLAAAIRSLVERPAQRAIRAAYARGRPRRETAAAAAT